MGDYPRPPVGPGVAPRQAYRADAVVSRIYFLLYGLAFVFGLLAAISATGSPGVTAYVAWANFAFIAVIVWLVFNLSEGRRWAFWSLIVVLGLLMSGNLLEGTVAPVLLNAPLWAYCVLRALGILKPGSCQDPVS